MNYMTGVYWERGKEAGVNQDSLLLLQVLTGRGRVLLAAVCDGMGGHMQGEAASAYVTKRLQEWFYESLLRAVQKKKPYWVIRRSLDRLTYHMQEYLCEYGGREKVELGTTMTVLVICGKMYLLWHLGDSRAYLIGQCGRKYGGRRYGGEEAALICMTNDHVRGKNRLTKCVGSFGYERPDFRMGQIGGKEAILLCSDGFRHCVAGHELADALHPGRMKGGQQIERRLREIGEACMRRGERDNMSAVYIKAMR